MDLEHVVLAFLVMILLVHILLGIVYSLHIRRLDREVVKTKPDVNGGDELDEAPADRVRMLAQAREDRTGNKYALIICAMCIFWPLMLVVLPPEVETEPLGWISLLLLPLPAFMLWHHLGNIYGSRVGRWLPWSGLAQSR